ncbi:MAG TPA: trypsin-like peptidase domain-containing protein [Baekduia sp.]|nr:trypsin-like peptidase domain-containing protein [Baekduia sp.]
MTHLLSPPPAPPAGGPPPEAPDPGPGPRRRRPTGPVAAGLAVLALVGGGAGAGLLSLTGALDHGSDGTTTIIRASGPTYASTSSSASSPGGLDARALYAAAAPGVVDITSNTTTQRQSPFGQQAQRATATGTGFVVDGQGHIVTAAHVVDNASKVTVRFQDGTTRTATVLGSDDATDLAVLDVDSSGLTLHPLKLGSTTSLQVGDPVAAIGDPFDYARSLSTGIVSGLDRTIQAPNGFTVAHAVQTDAALNPGNSGGPVLAADGTVVGVVDQIATNGQSEQSSGVGFAVPSDIVSAELSDLIAGRSVSHAYLGVSMADTTSTTSGAPVAAVTAGGPAARAGLRAGDVVTAIDGRAVQGSNDVVAAIAGDRPGDQVKLTVRRGGSQHTITVRLGTQPASSSSRGG